MHISWSTLPILHQSTIQVGLDLRYVKQRSLSRTSDVVFSIYVRDGSYLGNQGVGLRKICYTTETSRVLINGPAGHIRIRSNSGDLVLWNQTSRILHKRSQRIEHVTCLVSSTQNVLVCRVFGEFYGCRLEASRLVVHMELIYHSYLGVKTSSVSIRSFLGDLKDTYIQERVGWPTYSK